MKTNITHFTLVALFLACLAFPLCAVAMLPPPAPDGGYPNNNTAEGDGALANLGGGINNTAIGRSALSGNTDGSDNTAVGKWALEVSNSKQNTAVGSLTLDNNTADNNTAVGFEALLSNTNGTLNTGIGVGALAENTSGNDNTAGGVDALLNNTTGIENTAIGTFALSSSTKANDNTATGFQALFKTTEGQDNTADGVQALWSNTIGSANTATGEAALFFNTAGNNTADGYFALVSNTTGINNVAIGINAGGNLTTGSNNIDIGANVTGNAGEASTIRIGKQGTQKKTFVAGVRGVTVASGVGVIVGTTGQLGTVLSSAQFKEAIKPMDKASETILALKPVTFRYKEELDPDKIPQFGLVAEEVEKVNPDLVARDEEGKIMSVRYEAVNAMLLNEFLKEHRKVEAQQAQIAELKKQVETLATGLQKVGAAVAAQAGELRTAAAQP